jgi:tetratricopeptide (TPR) repeat protein
LDKPKSNPILVHLQSLLSYEEVDEMSTEEIIQQLDSFGIPSDKDISLQDIEICYSAQEISENWFETFNATAKGRDEDFPWMAAWVLWERLAPANNLSSCQASNLIDEGYGYLEASNSQKACDVWLTVWEAINYKCKPKDNRLDLLNQRYSEAFYISNLCQDLECELHNAGFRDKTYLEKRIDYCREFLTLFPDEGELITRDMRRAIADSYASLGNHEQAESELRELVQDYPNSPWGYIAWGDIYFFNKRDDYDLGYGGCQPFLSRVHGRR